VAPQPDPPLRDLLRELHLLDAFWPRLAAEVGVTCAADFLFVQEEDLAAIGMRPVPRRKLLHYAAKTFLRCREEEEDGDEEDEEEEEEAAEEEEEEEEAEEEGKAARPGQGRAAPQRHLRAAPRPMHATLPRMSSMTVNSASSRAPPSASKSKGGAASPAVQSANTALLRAIRSHSVEGMKLALAAGAEIEWPDPQYSQTPLVWACEKGADEAVALLLQAGACTGVADENGYTPLHHAIRSGLKEAPKLLLDAGAAVAATTTVRALCDVCIAHVKRTR
jgi:hypothetical protein